MSESSYIRKASRVRAMKLDEHNLDDVLEFINNLPGELYSAIGVAKPFENDGRMFVQVRERGSGRPCLRILTGETVVFDDYGMLYRYSEDKFNNLFQTTDQYIVDNFKQFNMGMVDLPKDIIKGHIIYPIDRLCPHEWSPWASVDSNLSVVEKWRSECKNCNERRYLENFR